MYLGKPVIGNFKPPREQRKRAKSPAEKRDGKEPAYLAMVRQLPCCVCRAPAPSECHHLKSGNSRGAALRAPDRDVLPLCHDCHINGVERVGSRREIQWFKERNVDCLTLASALYANKHSIDSMLAVLRAHVEANNGE